MKKLLWTLLCFTLLLPSFAKAGDGRVWTGNSKVNPTINTVLVTSGPINEAPNGVTMKIKVVISSTATAAFEFQLRDGVGAVVTAIRYGVLANSPSDLINFEFDVPTGYSLNVVNPAAVTGTIHVHILGYMMYGG